MVRTNPYRWAIGWTDAFTHECKHAHTAKCPCDNYVSLTANGPDKKNLTLLAFSIIHTFEPLHWSKFKANADNTFKVDQMTKCVNKMLQNIVGKGEMLISHFTSIFFFSHNVSKRYLTTGC